MLNAPTMTTRLPSLEMQKMVLRTGDTLEKERS